MESPWSKSEKKRIAQDLAEILARNGIPAKAVRQAGNYAITCPRGLIEHARLEFLETGEIACIARGFRMVDTPLRVSMFAAAILGKSLPGRVGDMTQYGFRRLECRSASRSSRGRERR